MHSLEYINRINDKVVADLQERMRLIDKTNDVETLKRWLRQMVNKVAERPFCGNCGQYKGVSTKEDME